MGFFSSVEKAPTDAIFLVKANYERDLSEDKVDVGIGAYRDENGKPYILPVVKKAEKILLNDATANHEYLGIGGDSIFIKSTKSFAFGEDSVALKEGRISTVQTLSGTGALRIGMDFIRQALGNEREVLVSSPTWGNHRDICTRAGLKFRNYRYWNAATKGLDFDGMMADIKASPDGTVILLHLCAHNPTGVDPSKSQWEEIYNICKQKRLIPFFDSAYQGYASGDCDNDAYGLRLFEKNGMELLLAQSYSKNMGLYGERVGALSIVNSDKKVAEAVESQLKKIIRAMYSNPPKHGAAIAGMILSRPELRKQWLSELKEMTDRIKRMRSGLRKELETLHPEQSWTFITDQIGMFTYTGLSPDQVDILQKKFHIYMPGTGRISIAGLTQKRLKYVATAIKSVL